MGSKPRSKEQKPGRRPRKRKLRHTEFSTHNDDSESTALLVQDAISQSEKATKLSPEEQPLSGDNPSESNTSRSLAGAILETADEGTVSDNADGLERERNSPTEESIIEYSGPISDTAAEESFKGFYLRKVTEELAEDLDKARSASDFTERSLPILIEALQQGVGTFSREERIRIGEAGASASEG